MEVEKYPKLLMENLPPKWKYKTEIAGIVGFLLAVNCRTDYSILGSDIASDAPAIVAPIFENGDGYGSTGCVVINPPVFLSEEEAIAVINNLLKVKGFHLSENNIPMENITVYHNKLCAYQNPERTEIPGENRPLEVDAYDSNKKLAIEFVSKTDSDKFQKKERDCNYWISAYSYNIKGAAEELSRRVKEDGKGVYFGTFYDPVADVDNYDPNDWYHDYSEEKREKSKQILKEQVQDFVKWLKAQGVI